MNRRELALVSLAMVAGALPARAQRSRPARIGFLSFLSASLIRAGLDPFTSGLRELGYMEGRDFQIESRYADGDNSRLPGLAAELVALNVDVIVTYATGVHAARAATASLPIVMANGGDPVAAGFATSLSHPGGNLTGLTFFIPELMSKRLELLKEIRPSLARCGVLLFRDGPSNGAILEGMRRTAAASGVALRPTEVRSLTDFDKAFSEWGGAAVQGVVVQDHALFTSNVTATARLATQYRLASAGPIELARQGGLLGYGVNFPDTFHRAAALVDKILKGAKAADIPIEQATNFHHVLNLRTAKDLGIPVPQSMLIQATQLIQ